MSDEKLILVDGMVVDRGALFKVSKTRGLLYRGRNIVTNWRGAQDGSTSIGLLSCSLMVTICWFPTGIVDLAIPW